MIVTWLVFVVNPIHFYVIIIIYDILILGVATPSQGSGDGIRIYFDDN